MLCCISVDEYSPLSSNSLYIKGTDGNYEGGPMAPELPLESRGFESLAMSPLLELGAYEAMWDNPGVSFKTISEKFAARPGSRPSDFVPAKKAGEYADFVRERFKAAHIDRFGVRVHGAGEYPEKLRDAAHPVELIYYQGWWDLVESRCVAVVGARKPSDEGAARTRRLVRELVKDDFTIVSGLATGIDTAVHESAIAAALTYLSAEQCNVAASDRARLSAHQSGAGAAL
jgi:DNA processing protein